MTKPELCFVDIAALSDEQTDKMSSLEDASAREKLLLEHSRPAKDVSVDEVKRIERMSFKYE
eukprot:CAMPEP_0119491660 /NCGR_PEP_ID=MMETSP1344-20130328/16462_1 /TAXON_ID=236787 /ORGANISM="Florenciella parvula, Strain CCMP2471" /LENGTH=61 /DNA_ID=CAMNT_0007526921 /DNA_START=48 /DNA_END=230 /DNA_ORIENTATION=+